MRAQAIVKRGIDIGLCLLSSPIAVPLCILLLFAIRIETSGSPLFIQARVGRGGKPFRMFKLRTMLADTMSLPSHDVCVSRITRVGKLLRILKLDELPQILNVLVGSMSLVGPRPCLVTQAAVIEARREMGVLDYRPGITGPAQLQGVDMSEPLLMAQIEAAYFSRATIWSDFRLLIQTFTGGGRGDAALRRSRG